MSERPKIDEFLDTLHWRYRAWNSIRAVAPHAITLALLLCVLEWAWPAALVPVAVGGAAWLGAAAGWAWWRERLRVAEADRVLGLRDRLVTWAQLRRRPIETASAPFRAWLGSDLEADLDQLPDERQQRVWRRPLGAARYLVPLLVLLLLLRWFAPLPPASPGLEGPSMASGSGEGSGGDGAPEPGDGPPEGGGEGTPDDPETAEEPDSSDAEEDEEDEEAAPPEPEPAPQPLPEPQASPPPPDEGAEAEAAPAEPLLERLPLDVLAIPEFIGDGPSRRELAPVAVLPEGPGGAGTPPPAGGAARPPAPDLPGPEDYAKAQERALAARHVPATERPFVIRFFEEIAKAPR
ncbi:MAG: hypothetical protein AAF628_00285 [Planctomycetota bacterium]